MFGKLRTYKEIHGDCYVLSNYTDASLANWVVAQRQCRLNLPMHQANALEEIGFVWDPLETAWCKMYDKLVAFSQTYSDCEVPHIWPNDTALGFWVHAERLSHKRKRLSPSREARLNAIRFRWSTPREQNKRELRLWDKNYEKPEAFTSEYGHCHVPITYHDKKIGLVGEISTQKPSAKSRAETRAF
jgi:hypothetical protein